MAGIKLRMPGGDAWQFLGQALGANPTPMAYAEVYTGLQTGAIDGQDNPLPNVENMKFYEVMYADRPDLAPRRLSTCWRSPRQAWDAMTPEQQAAFQAAADAAIDWSTAEHLDAEAELVEQSSRTQGLEDLRARRRRPSAPTCRRCISNSDLAKELARRHRSSKINAL